MLRRISQAAVIALLLWLYLELGWPSQSVNIPAVLSEQLHQSQTLVLSTGVQACSVEQRQLPEREFYPYWKDFSSRLHEYTRRVQWLHTNHVMKLASPAVVYPTGSLNACSALQSFRQLRGI